MFVEDVVLVLKRLIDQRAVPRMKQWDISFITDIALYINQNSSLSTSQCDVVLTIIRRYQSALVNSGVHLNDLNSLIKNPTYRNPPYESTKIPREVRYAGNSQLAFKFKYNQEISTRLNSIHPTVRASYCRFSKLTYVMVDLSNYKEVMDFISRNSFDFDEHVVEFLTFINNNKEPRVDIKMVDGEIVLDVCNNAILATLANILEVNDEKCTVDILSN